MAWLDTGVVFGAYSWACGWLDDYNTIARGWGRSFGISRILVIEVFRRASLHAYFGSIIAMII
jgi:hypothetical protein